MDQRAKFRNYKKILIDKYLKHGASGLLEHELLELILLVAGPRRNVRSIAGDLLGRYSSLKAVQDAPISDLLKFPLMDVASAINIKLMKDCSKDYL